MSASFPHWTPVSFTFEPRSGELLTGPPMAGGPPTSRGRQHRRRARAGRLDQRGPQERATDPPGVGAPPFWPSPPSRRSSRIAHGGGPRTCLRCCSPPSLARGVLIPRRRQWLRGHRLGRPRDLPRRETGVNRRGVFLPGNQGVDPCLPPTSVRVWPMKTIHRAGRSSSSTGLRPSAPPRAWCPGRYRSASRRAPKPAPTALYHAALHRAKRDVDLLRRQLVLLRRRAESRSRIVVARLSCVEMDLRQLSTWWRWRTV